MRHASPRRRRGRAWRIARIILLAVLLPVAIYLVGANVFLSTSLFASVVDKDPDVIDVHFSRAWTILPGHIHAEHLTIRGRDRNVEWLLQLDEADFDVSLLRLPRKQFVCSSVHGRGISFRIRRRLEAEPSSPEDVADLPEIPGFGQYSLIPIGPPERSDWPDAKYPLWSVRLEHVRADDVREVWIDHVRLAGSQDIDGRFYFKPVRALEVGPAVVRVARGAIFQGSRTLVDSLDGSHGVYTLSRLDLRAMSARAFVRHSSFVGTGHVRFADAAALPLPLPSSLTTRGAAVAHGDVRVTGGVLEPGTRVEVGADDAVFLSKPYEVSTDVAFVATVQKSAAEKNELQIEAALTDVAALAGSDRATLARAPRVVVHAAASDVDLAGEHPLPFEDIHGDVAIDRAELDAAVAARTWASKLPLDAAGTIEVSGFLLHASPVARRMSGEVALRSYLTAGTHGVRVSARVDVRAAVDSIDLAARKLDGANVTVDLTDLELASAKADAGREPAARIHRIVADAQAPHWDLADPSRVLRAHAALTGGKIADARALDALLPARPIRFEGEQATIEAEASATLTNRALDGKVFLSARRVGVSAGKLHLLGDAALSGDLAWDTEANTMNVRDARADVTDIAGRWAERRGSDFTIARVAFTGHTPRLDLSKPRFADVDLHATLERASIPDARAFNALLPKGAPTIEAGAGWADAEIAIDGGAKSSSGWVDFAVGHAGIHLADKHVTGDVRAVLVLRSTDFARGIFDIAGSHVELREAVLRGAPARTPRGIADFAVDGVLRLDSEPMLDAPVRARALDVGPVLEFLVPKGLARALVDIDDERSFGGAARFVADAHRFAVLDVEARGGDISTVGNFVTGGDHRLGAFVATKGPLAAGIAIDDGGSDVKLFALDSWLAAKAREIRRMARVRPQADGCIATALACR